MKTAYLFDENNQLICPITPAEFRLMTEEEKKFVKCGHCNPISSERCYGDVEIRSRFVQSTGKMTDYFVSFNHIKNCEAARSMKKKITTENFDPDGNDIDVYVVSDLHGFYTEFRLALKKAGYDDDQEPHKLIICGDLFDRGNEAPAMQQFILNLMHEDKVILIRGNHEDLFSSLVNEDNGIPYPHHLSNGTFSTALQLTGYDPTMARINNCDFAEAARETPLYKEILPAMADYYETANYVFVHGWIPGFCDRRGYHYFSDWRECGRAEWEAARWYNGMNCISSTLEEKTIVCGHWHTSYGHCRIEEKCSEFGPDADFSPYIAPGIIAIDACTAHSGIVNCIVIED